MESAGSPPRFFALLLPFNLAAAARGLAIGGVLGLAAVGRFLDSAAHFRFAVALCVLLSLWHVHLERSGVSRAVSLAALALLAWQIHSAPHSLYDSAALGGGLFVYLTVWVLAAYDRQPGLQSLAGAALLLSAGVLAKPAIAISCAILSLALFAAHVRSTANRLGFGLLLFTPALLCSLGVLAFGLMTAGTLRANPFFPHVSAGAADNAHIWRYLFFLPVAAVAFRAIRRRFRGPDLAYLAMLAMGSVICLTRWPQDALSLEDLFFIAAGGAAALLANTEAPAAAGAAPAPSTHPESHRGSAPASGF
jgi:hypothetical protein